jgi:hypothetical protein
MKAHFQLLLYSAVTCPVPPYNCLVFFHRFSQISSATAVGDKEAKLVMRGKEQQAVLFTQKSVKICEKYQTVVWWRAAPCPTGFVWVMP